MYAVYEEGPLCHFLHIFKSIQNLYATFSRCLYYRCGQHISLPKAPAPLSNNTLARALTLGGPVGLLFGLLRWPFRRYSWSFTLKAASYSTALLTGVEVAAHQLSLSRLKQAGVKIDLSSRRLMENLGAVETDDIVFGAAALGVLIALSPRMFVGSTGWTRCFGAAAVANVVTGPALSFIFGQNQLRELTQERAKQQEKRREWFRSHGVKSIDINWNKWFSAEGARSIEAEPDKAPDVAGETGKTSLIVPNQPESTVNPDVAIDKDGRRTDIPYVDDTWDLSSKENPSRTLQEHVAKLKEILETHPRSVRRPHLAVIEDGKQVSVPYPDYSWTAPSDEEYRSIYEKHIRDLVETKTSLTKTADYLWATMIKKQGDLYTPQSTKEEQSRSVQEFIQLHQLHLRAYTEIAWVTWMIAHSMRDLQQSEGMPKHLQERSDPQDPVMQKHAQDRQAQILSALRKSKDQHMQSIESALEWMRHNVKKTEEILRIRNHMVAQELNPQGQHIVEFNESSKVHRTRKVTPDEAKSMEVVTKEGQGIGTLSMRLMSLKRQIKEAEAELESLRNSGEGCGSDV